ncbi:MAG: YdcF family protein [Mariniphaga sp.]|nr:YdcF family protein [Mariniphaga sp.]MDD4225280.1 YdcF family protein [Mariniphaga sp.]
MRNSGIKNILFLRILRIIFGLSGIFFLSAIIISFTTLPFWGIYWLGMSKTEPAISPATIIMLGGGGMPSESNLIRSWYMGMAAKNFPEAKVVIAIPGNITDSMSTSYLVKEELLIRGIQPSRILFENKGANTRSQALYCSRILDIDAPVLLITSPEHTRRAVLCFQKTGFRHVHALPAFENAIRADLTFNDDELGGRKVPAPDVGQSIQIRYQVWNHLKYEISFIREIIALGYYKLRGWI